MGNLMYAPKIGKRLIISLFSRDGLKFVGRDREGNYYKGYVRDLEKIVQ